MSGTALKQNGLVFGSRGVASIVIAVTRLGLGCVFLWSSLPKIRQPYDFLSGVYEYELVGPTVGIAVAMVVPWMELVLGIALVGGVFAGGALLGSAILLGVFVACHASVLYRGLAIGCACFGGTGQSPIDYGTLVRTGLLALTSGVAYLLWVRRSLARDGCEPDGRASSTDVPAVGTSS
jgi:uncharacterized membrane protein YphA (DoxX/SURF4 family)